MSMKKMHSPTVVVHPTTNGQIGGGKMATGGSLMLTNVGGKTAKDRQNAENIVPSQNGTNGKTEPPANATNNATNAAGGGKKAISKASSAGQTAQANSIKTASQTSSSGGNAASAISTLNSTNRRRSHRISSPNRRRQEQQNIFNSLKAWNVKIVPSGQPPAEKSENGTSASSSSISSSGAIKAISERSSSASSSTSGSVSSSVSSNTSSNGSVNSNSSSSTNSSNNNVKHKKQQQLPVATATASTVQVKGTSAAVVVTGGQRSAAEKEEASNQQQQQLHNGLHKETGKSEPTIASSVSAVQTTTAVLAVSGGQLNSQTAAKGEKKLLNAGGGLSVNHRHPAATISPSQHSSSNQSSVTATVSSLSQTSSGSGGSSTTHPSSTTITTAAQTSPANTNHSRHHQHSNNGGSSRASNAGKVLLPNVNPMSGTPLDPISLLQGKLRTSMKLESYITSATPQTHHISNHHSTHSHHQGGGQGQQQHPSQQMTPTTPPHYSLDFLHYVGMRMSTANGTSQSVNASSAAAASALLRGNPHFNYNNFNQQLHQQQQQQQIMHHQQQQQQQHHLQRHYPNYYNCDEYLLQSTGAGDPMYTNFAVSDQVPVNGGGNSTGNGSGNGANDAGLAYCYSQNHQHHPPQHHHNHQQQQQPFVNGGFHQNNNYQQHNRNYGRGGQGNGNIQPGGKKSWNNSWYNGKKLIQGKYGNRGSNFNGHGGYRKSYHYYNNNHHNGIGGNGHYYDQQHANQQSDHLRNLVYIKGYDRGGPAVSGSQESTSRSPTPSPKSASPSIDTSDVGHSNGGPTSLQDDRGDSGIEESGSNRKKQSIVPSSASSTSSVVSIPSTDSSTVLASAVHNLSLDLQCVSGQGYESDSSHSSSYNSHTYRHRKYTSGGNVYRSSSSTSSGVSSTATFPPLGSDYPTQCSPSSATNTPSSTASSNQVADFFLRSQSYHGSHQNLTAISGSASPNPPDSPISTPRPIVGTQSMPMFSELFTGPQQQQQQKPKQQRSEPSSHYGSHNSLEITLQGGVGGGASSVTSTSSSNSSASSTTSSSSSGSSNNSIASHGGSSGYGSSVPASTVPPNEVYSMQSGHPKKRYSGRTSPTPFIASHKPNRTAINGGSSSVTVTTSSQHAPQQHSPHHHHHQQQQQHQNQQLQQYSPTNRKGQPAWSQQKVHSATTTAAAPAVVPTAPVPAPKAPATAASTTTTTDANGATTSVNTQHGPLMFPADNSNLHTPADRFLARAHLVELTAPPCDLAPAGSKWAPLSQAIWDKFAAAQQTQQKFVEKIHLWRYLFMCIRKAFPRFSLYLVGSTISGFASDSSDVDMCLVCRTNTIPFDMRGEALFQLGQLKNYFMNISTYFEEFSVIQAKVPILRFRDTTNSIVVDLNYNNCVGIRNTHLLYLYSQMDWRLRPLTLVVKLWAQHHNINDAKNMTISSYSLVLMVIHFLQYGVNPPILPCLHAKYPDKFVRMSDISTLDLTETVEPYKNDNNATLGELFLQFLEYYANFDYAHYAISVRTASVISIESARVAKSYKNDPHHWRQLCIEEPFDLTNTARSVFDAEIFEQIKSVFSTCWRRLKDTNDLSSVFECEPLFIPVASTLSLTS